MKDPLTTGGGFINGSASSAPVSAGARPKGGSRLLRVAAYAVAILALFRLISTADLGGVRATLRFAGPLAALALLPFGAQVLLECASLRLLLARLGSPVAWAATLRANLVAEAIRLTLPGGAPIAEGMVTRMCGGGKTGADFRFGPGASLHRSLKRRVHLRAHFISQAMS